MDKKLLASEDANIQKTLLRQLSIMFQLNTIGERILSKRHYNAKSKKKEKRANISVLRKCVTYRQKRH